MDGVKCVDLVSLAPLSGKDLLGQLHDPSGYGDPWSNYCDSKAANVLFTQSLARKVGGAGVRSLAYHPGVMYTDLWRGGTSGGAVEQGSLIRTLCAPCIKHPLVSGGGSAALAAPLPSCYPCRGPLATVCCGDGGGYYQQLLCCMVIPVRAHPTMYNTASKLPLT